MAIGRYFGQDDDFAAQQEAAVLQLLQMLQAPSYGMGIAPMGMPAPTGPVSREWAPPPMADPIAQAMQQMARIPTQPKTSSRGRTPMPKKMPGGTGPGRISFNPRIPPMPQPNYPPKGSPGTTSPGFQLPAGRPIPRGGQRPTMPQPNYPSKEGSRRILPPASMGMPLSPPQANYPSKDGNRRILPRLPKY